MKEYLISIIHAIDGIINLLFIICIFILGFNIKDISLLNKLFWILFIISIIGVIFIPDKEILKLLFK